MQTLEGDWKPKRIVVTEFPSIEQVRRCYDSEEYRRPEALRLRTATASAAWSKERRAGGATST